MYYSLIFYVNLKEILWSAVNKQSIVINISISVTNWFWTTFKRKSFIHYIVDSYISNSLQTVSTLHQSNKGIYWYVPNFNPIYIPVWQLNTEFHPMLVTASALTWHFYHFLLLLLSELSKAGIKNVRSNVVL